MGMNEEEKYVEKMKMKIFFWDEKCQAFVIVKYAIILIILFYFGVLSSYKPIIDSVKNFECSPDHLLVLVLE